MGSILLNDVHVGTGSVVAAGAVVPEGTRVPPGSLVVGVPARGTRAVDGALRQRVRHTWQHYVAEAERHRAGEVVMGIPGAPYPGGAGGQPCSGRRSPPP